MRIVMAVVVLGMAVGCGGGQQLMQKQFADVEQRLLELQKSQARMTVTVQDLETRLFLVQDELDTQRKRVARTRKPEHHLPVVRVKRQAGPDSAFDPMADRPRTASADPGVLRYDRFDEAGDLVRGAEPARKAEPQGGPHQRPVPLPQSDLDASRLYQTAKQALDNDQHVKAVETFRSLVERFPTHTLADNALYWMGEAYYDRRLWTEALKHFQQVLQNYPLGNKAPDAMLKLGLCHAQLGKTRQAREVLTQVTEIYNDTPVAKLATRRLEQLP